ncbi:Sec23-binding domain of Sec16-domain-containing protein [Xylariomycetidae sp. FL2044]|nr:Sec23-binding domain of Sec16-domain-containing protein [Xylariomycetidae sp. FL2044]
MQSDPPNASWHPAMMPNSNPETTSSNQNSVRIHHPSISKNNHQLAAEEVHPDPSSIETPGQESQQPQVSSEPSFFDQFHDEGDSAGAAVWNLSDPPAAPEPDPAPVEEDHQDSLARDDGATTANTRPASPEHTPSANAAKHSSTISFARTVSHEVSFNDDEDADWNLQRTETDPFKFMPPNERTNSFPVVPQLTSSNEDQAINHPPPSSQAQDILRELEQEDAPLDSSSPLDFLNHNDQRQEDGQHPETGVFHQAVGGDLVGPDEEASDARYQEGMPLIPQEEHQSLTEPTPSNGASRGAPDFDDPFAQGDGGDAEDDFFNQVQDDPHQTEDQDEFDRTLHRKSTTMVIGKNISSRAPTTNMDSEAPTPTEENAPKVATEPDVDQEESAPVTAQDIASRPESNDLDAKWAAAFGDDEDDEFLVDSATTETKEFDPADVFGSDDEGFLEDTIEDAPAQPPVSVSHPTSGRVDATAQPPQSAVNGRYTPGGFQQQERTQPLANPYAPNSVISQVQLPPQPLVHPGTAPPVAMGYAAPPPKPEMPKAQSFASKSKGGYSSPYDLPMEVVRPRKRVSMQQLPKGTGTPSAHTTAPPRSTSMYNQPPLQQPPPTAAGSNASLSPPTSSHSNHQPPPLVATKSTPQLKSKPSFFEDLPMASRPRPASRQSNLASPPGHGPHGYPSGPPPGPPQAHLQGPQVSSSPMAPPPGPRRSSQDQPAGIPALVAPERASPYAPMQSNLQAKSGPPPVTSSKYSPAPHPAAGQNGALPPVSTSRYSPAPPSRPASAGYTAVPPPILHQPRTSSPLAHFEVSHDKSQTKIQSPSSGENISGSRSSSSQHEPRITRVPSLPTTREVEEEHSPLRSPPIPGKTIAPPPESRYNPSIARHTPPPAGLSPSNPLSPPKRSTSSYLPQSPVAVQANQPNFVPPPRSQTQSPGALHGSRTAGRPIDPIPRPLSVQGAASAQKTSAAESSRTTVRARGMSQALHLVPPTDGRELDALQRWRGAPVISWGVGGSLISSFPKDVPRYGINQALPQIVRSPGEVKVRHIKDIQALEERLAKFPGPLKGKSKKKETSAWLSAGIEALERALPHVSFQQHVSHEDKRAVERVLLWKILRLFIENDGVLEGNTGVEKAVRDVISPGMAVASPELASAISAGADLTGITSPVTGMQSDAVDSSVVEQIRKHLLSGEREKAVWAAVDKRLWGHALLLSNMVQSPELYKQVAQEFIKKEVNHPGHGNESLAALYGVLSGNFDESVDELVPVHARAGLQLMSTSTAIGASQDALAGLDKWRETLGLILSNRNLGDAQALRSLGNLLSQYGRAEAAHICYIFARQQAVFGGLDDPNANFVLVGADHRRQADQFAKETEALQLSEVYEYGLSLGGGSNATQTCPHLAAYKLQHAMVLAEYGFRDKALQYCEGIYNAITAQTKRSPYYNSVLESSADDLMRRLKQAPKEESSSWIPKPTMDKVSNNMWSRFNKFVAGDDDDGSGNGALGDAGAESGPFARIAGGTPTISRSPSVSNFEVYGTGGPSPTIPATRAGSRYAPGAPQSSGSPYEPSSSFNPAPKSPLERSSSDMPRTSHEMLRPGGMQQTYGNPYAPDNQHPSVASQQTLSTSAPQATTYMPTRQESEAAHPPSQSSYSYAGYDPYGANQASPGGSANLYAPVTQSDAEPSTHDISSSLGYQPPSYGYEPPSMNTFEPPASQPENATGGYEPPSYQPSGFEPPSYEPGPADADSPTETKPKKKSFMDDDDDDIPALRPQEKSKTDKDRENEEMFRKVAEEEAKRAAEAKAAPKKGWGFGGWFGGGNKKEQLDQQPNKPIKAKLGEASSFVYDPDLKRWVNKKPGAENTPAKTATPPPPRAAYGAPPPPGGTPAPPGGIAPPPGPPSARGTPPPPAALNKAASQESLHVPGMPPTMTRTVSNQSTASAPGGPPSAPPSRPATSLSNASSIDDLLGASGPRKGARKPRKSGRYVDVMAK